MWLFAVLWFDGQKCLRKTERGSVILSRRFVSPTGRWSLWPSRWYIISQLSSSFADEIKARIEQKQQHEEQRVVASSFSRPKEQPKLFPPKSKEERTRRWWRDRLLKKRTTNPPPKMHRFFRGEKQRATRSKARRVTHHKEDKTRNTRTCLVITLQCANAEALWAIMDCILFLFVCVFEVILGGNVLSWFSIKNPKSYLVFLPWIVEGGAGSVYILVVALRRRRRRRRRRRVLQSVWCVLIYIYLYIFSYLV